MKVKQYGYDPKKNIGFVTYKPSFVEKVFGVKEKKKIYKRNLKETYLIGGNIWIDLKTGREERNKYLDCALNLCDI